MAEQQNLPHSLTLNERKRLTLTGATEVVSFDETSVIIQTALGMLVIQGQQLQLKTLSENGGNVTVEGEISSLTYEDPRSVGGWFSRLFR